MYNKETVLEVMHLATEGIFLDQDEILYRLDKIPEEFQKEILATILSIHATLTIANLM